MEIWATFSIIDHLKPIGDQTQGLNHRLELATRLESSQAKG
jgi:hypothetical protein